MSRSKNRLAFSRRVRLCMGPIVLTLVGASAAAAAEDSTLQQPVTPGVRIRIQAPEAFPGKLVGTVNAVSTESLSIDVPGRSEPVSVLREKIAHLDVSNGPRSRGIDAAIGAGIGAAVGAAGGALASSNQRGHIVSSGEVAAVCAVLGVGVGALIGAAIPPGERWTPVAPNRYRVSFVPTLDHGLDLAVALKF